MTETFEVTTGTINSFCSSKLSTGSQDSKTRKLANANRTALTFS